MVGLLGWELKQTKIVNMKYEGNSSTNSLSFTSICLLNDASMCKLWISTQLHNSSNLKSLSVPTCWSFDEGFKVIFLNRLGFWVPANAPVATTASICLRKEAKSLRFQPISRNAINLKQKKYLVQDKWSLRRRTDCTNRLIRSYIDCMTSAFVTCLSLWWEFCSVLWLILHSCVLSIISFVCY